MTLHLFLFAHQDDEVFVLPVLRRLVEHRAEVACVFLSSGSATNDHAEIARREHESLAVLGQVGVPRERVSFPGRVLGVPDGAVHAHGTALLARLSERFCDAPERLYLPAWEGGHHDHDAVHVIGRAFAARGRDVGAVVEYCTYNAHGRPAPLFRVLDAPFRAGPEPAEPYRFGASDVAAILRYPSQWRSWVGLGPFVLLRWLLRRPCVLRSVRGLAAGERPHGGALLYERRFGVSFETLRDALVPLLEPEQPERTPS